MVVTFFSPRIVTRLTGNRQAPFRSLSPRADIVGAMDTDTTRTDLVFSTSVIVGAIATGLILRLLGAA